MNRKMVALVVGNANYNHQNAKLLNATNDANDLAKELEALGFTVMCKTDCTNLDFDKSVGSFKESLNSNDVGLFYFAGHGMQIGGENYITATDTDFSEELSAKWSSFPLNKLIEIMEGCSNKTNIIILDACRNNPYVRAWNSGLEQRGLAAMFAPKGTIIAYSTSPGETASDGSGRNGAYTEALLKHISRPDLTIENIFKKVRNSLSISTKGKQTSWEHTSLTGEFYFNISLGKKVQKYAKNSINDELFTINTKMTGHDLILSLKSHNWYTQNPAIRSVNAETLSGFDNDLLFILGRNVYQAACGSSDGAFEFIKSFRTKTNELAKEKSICILDGMLFEIFFNSKGNLRDNFKTFMFNQVFELQKFDDFSPAFEFISECLVPYQERFYVIPGKQVEEISVDIELSPNENGENLVLGVYFEGDNLLKVDERYSIPSEDGKTLYEPIRYSAFAKKVSEQMVVPKRMLNINSTLKLSDESKMLFPYGGTMGRG